MKASGSGHPARLRREISDNWLLTYPVLHLIRLLLLAAHPSIANRKCSQNFLPDLCSYCTVAPSCLLIFPHTLCRHALAALLQIIRQRRLEIVWHLPPPTSVSQRERAVNQCEPA